MKNIYCMNCDPRLLLMREGEKISVDCRSDLLNLIAVIWRERAKDNSLENGFLLNLIINMT